MWSFAIGWKIHWDVASWTLPSRSTSILLALSLGTAVGVVIRGALDWFAILCGVFALAVLTLQSAAWMTLKSTGGLQRRCRRLAEGIWWAVVLCYAGVTAASLAAEPHMLDRLLAHSTDGTSICALSVIALAGLIGTRLCLGVCFDLGAFASASCLIAGLLTTVAAGQFPYLLTHNLTVYNAGSSASGLNVSALWWIPAFALAV